MKLPLSAATVVLLLVSSVVVAGDWIEFLAPGKSGLADADVPLEWSETKNIAWKVPISGLAWSSPVVQDDRIYLTTAIPDGAGKTSPQSLRVMCLKAGSGETVWDVEAFAQSGGDDVEMHGKNSHASPTPIIDGDRLYVHFGPHGTACLNRSDGSFVWKTLELVYSPTHGTGGSPALAGDVLVICCDGHDVQYVAGLNKNTGDIVWKTPRDTTPDRGFSFSTPLIIEAGGREQAVCPGSSAVFSYDPETGEEIWRVDYGSGYSVVPRPLFGNGLIYVCSGFGDVRVLAIDPTGTGDVTDSHVKWTLDRGAPKSPSPVLVGKELFVVDDRGIATCVDAETGQVHWQERIGGNFSASPTFAGGRVYLQDENGETTVIEADPTFKVLAKNQLADGERTFASFAIEGDAILLRSEKHLYRIEE